MLEYAWHLKKKRISTIFWAICDAHETKVNLTAFNIRLGIFER